MAFNAGSITGILGLDTDPFAKGMLRAQSVMSLFPASVTNFLASPLLGVIGLAKQAGSALVDAFTSATKHADDLGDMAKNLGISVEVLSGMELASRNFGGNVEKMADAFKFLAKNAAEAARAPKGTDAQNFRDIGVSAIDAFGAIKPLPELMMEVSDGLARMKGSGDETRIAMGLLGRSGSDMIGFLTQGSVPIKDRISVMHRWGAVVTEESRRSADAWQDSMGDIDSAWQGVKNQFAGQLRVTLLPYLEDLLKWINTHQPEIHAFIDTTSKKIAAMIPIVQTLYERVQKVINSLPNIEHVKDELGLTNAQERLGRPNQLALVAQSIQTSASDIVGEGAVGLITLNDAARKALSSAAIMSGAMQSMLAGRVGDQNFGFQVRALGTSEFGEPASELALRLAKRSGELNRRLVAIGQFKPEDVAPADVETLLTNLKELADNVGDAQALVRDFAAELDEAATTDTARAAELFRQQLGLSVPPLDSARRELQDTTNRMRDLQRTAIEATEALAGLAAGAGGAGGGTPTTQPTTQPSSQVFNIEVKVPPIDVDAVSSEIGRQFALKLKPEIEKRFILLRTAAVAASIRGGL